MYLDSNIVIVDLFEDVVKTLRDFGSITSVTEDVDANTTHVESINGLVVNDVVEIDSVDYIVKNPTVSGFDVDGVGLHGNTSWYKKAPYYLHGHMLEIANKLTKLDGDSQIYQFQKYPLVALIQDFPEKREEGTHVTVTLRILIMNITDKNYTSDDRYTNNFKPVLYPLYTRLIQALARSRVFQSVGNSNKHTKTDRLFWGTQLAMMNNRNIMNDYIDAIEITDFSFEILTKC